MQDIHVLNLIPPGVIGVLFYVICRAVGAARARKAAFKAARNATDDELRTWSIHDLELVHGMFIKRLKKPEKLNPRAGLATEYAYRRDRIAALLDELRVQRDATYLEEEKRRQRQGQELPRSQGPRP